MRAGKAMATGTSPAAADGRVEGAHEPKEDEWDIVESGGESEAE